MEDRKALIRLAAALPTGSDERRAILASLRTARDGRFFLEIPRKRVSELRSELGDIAKDPKAAFKNWRGQEGTVTIGKKWREVWGEEWSEGEHSALKTPSGGILEITLAVPLPPKLNDHSWEPKRRDYIAWYLGKVIKDSYIPAYKRDFLDYLVDNWWDLEQGNAVDLLWDHPKTEVHDSEGELEFGMNCEPDPRQQLKPQDVLQSSTVFITSLVKCVIKHEDL